MVTVCRKRVELSVRLGRVQPLDWGGSLDSQDGSVTRRNHWERGRPRPQPAEGESSISFQSLSLRSYKLRARAPALPVKRSIIRTQTDGRLKVGR
jgi:hypothetical protein